jgi:hypothetical protein
MTIVRYSRRRWWIALAAFAALSSATACASSCETTGSDGPTAAERVTVGFPAALLHHKLVDEKSLSNADRLPASTAGRTYKRTFCDHCTCCSQPLVGPTSQIGQPVDNGRNDRAAAPARVLPRARVHIVRLHGGPIVCWGGRPAANLPKEVLGDPDDDETSDNPNDDDDAYDDLNVYDETGVSIVAWLPEPALFLFAPDFAPKTWVAPHPSTPFSRLLRLRC